MSRPEWLDSRFEAYCIMVGAISGLWAQSEYALDQTIWELANVEMGVGACMTAQMIGPAPRIRALQALVHYRDPDCVLLKELTAHGSLMKKLGAKRNRYMHDAVYIGLESGTISRTEVTADHRLSFRQVSVHMEEMDCLATEIRKMGIAFANLRNRIFGVLPPWPRDQFAESPSGFRLMGAEPSPDETSEEA